jgi:release factor glutamine methyltransferase
MLLEHVLACPRSWLLAHDTDALTADQVARFERLVARRNVGEPMAYLVGTREFMGHVFVVGPDVLIPRPDTEVLVETVLAVLAGCPPQARVLDLGTGSGAIAVSIALARPTAQVIATDICAAALEVARGNAQALGARNVQWLQSSWYDALSEDSRFDVIVSNPPYIAHDDPHLREGDLRFEPRLALTDEGDGLANLRHIIAGGRSRLRQGGVLWMEHGWRQAADVREILVAQGFAEVASKCDLNGIERIAGGRWGQGGG